MREMFSAFSNLIRVCIAIAMGLGIAIWLPAGNVAAGSVVRECGCSMCAGEPACCAVPGDAAPVQQPASPALRVSSEGQPLTLADRPMMMVPIPEVAIAFPDPEDVPCVTVAGHSFQSVRCMWMV